MAPIIEGNKDPLGWFNPTFLENSNEASGVINFAPDALTATARPASIRFDVDHIRGDEIKAEPEANVVRRQTLEGERQALFLEMYRPDFGATSGLFLSRTAIDFAETNEPVPMSASGIESVQDVFAVNDYFGATASFRDLALDRSLTLIDAGVARG